jgi:uncharacterized protein YbjQ (UPF0145 family)
MTKSEFLDLEIPDAKSVLCSLPADEAATWREAYQSQHRVDLENYQPPKLTAPGTFLPMATTPGLPGFEVERVLGLVTGSAVVAGNNIGAIMDELTSFTRGRGESLEIGFDESRRRALEQLDRRAQAMEADAVIGLTFTTTAFGPNNDFICTSAAGTAVMVAQKSCDLPRTLLRPPGSGRAE